MTEQVTWTTKSGKAATVTVELRRNMAHVANSGTGPIIKDKGLVIDITGSVEGMGVIGEGYTVVTDALRKAVPAYATLYAVVGSKLGITEESVGRQIEAAIAKVAANPEYVAQQEARAARRAEVAADDAMAEKIEATP
jgi:hypothetical protein